MLKNLCVLLISCLLFGCVREDMVEIEPMPENDKLVVFGLLTPANHVYVQVGKSQSFGSGRYEADKFYVNDAVVTITNDEEKEIRLQLVNDREGLYSASQAEFPIKPGGTYRLKVEAPLRETVTASTMVPPKKAVWKEAGLYGYMNESYGGLIYQLIGGWNTISNSVDIGYGVAVLYPSVEMKILQHENEGILPQGNEYAIKREVYVANDNSIDAVLITRDRYYNDFSKTAELTVDVLNYYHNAVFADIISGFKGVIPQSGNIENGLGVFGSYLTDSRTLYKN